ncbi:hypothetical protein ACFLV0_03635 [Chloroflexota bacterium]
MVVASLTLSPIRDRSLQRLALPKDELAKVLEQAGQLVELVKPLVTLSTREQLYTPPANGKGNGFQGLVPSERQRRHEPRLSHKPTMVG